MPVKPGYNLLNIQNLSQAELTNLPEMSDSTSGSGNKTVIFSPAVYNLAETTRALEIANAIRKDFKILFVSYGGEFEGYIQNEGYQVHHLEPTLTSEKIEHLYKVDQGQTLGYFFTTAEVRKQVSNEIELFKRINPAAVVTGFNFSNSISARAAGIPLVWVTQSTWMMDAMFKAGLGNYFDMLDIPPLNWLPDHTLTWLSWKSMGLTNLVFRPFNTVAREYGLKAFTGMESMWEGDYNLLAEPEGFNKLQVPSTYHYIGPLIGRLDEPIPEEIQDLPHDSPRIYFAMGSSGQGKVIAEIVEGFAGRPYRVIAPVKNHLDGIDVRIPDNVIVTSWLPAHKVNPMCDISIIHGGIGTVMTACLAGTPVVGVSMMPEQEANIDCLVRLGFAARIRKNRLTPDDLCEAVDNLLQSEDAKRKALEFKALTESWDDPEIVRDFFRRTFEESK